MHNDPQEDQRWMERALDLAERATGLTSPNPTVGCVLVKNGLLLGEGAHIYENKDHAEIAALKAASDSPQGATAYVTLEPCSHTGRTGPCADALVRSGVARVVSATGDPNPEVRGRGFEKLRAAGIAVEIGVGETKARALNEGFARWIQTQRPFVTMKIAMSLDGRIAPPPELRSERTPWWITGPEARKEVQEMRHAQDAILTGIDTVLADNPQLTDRSGKPRRQSLLRIVLDSQLRLPLTSKLVEEPGGSVLILTTKTASKEKRLLLEERGVEVAVLPKENNRLNLSEVFKHLGARRVLSLMIESGPRLNSALLTGGHVDRLRIFSAPVLLGDKALPAFMEAGEPLRLEKTSTHRFGEDLAWDALLRDPWSEARD